MTYADRIPAPRPIPNMSARFADARRCGHTPEQHRHDDGQAADAASSDRAIRELTADRDHWRRELNNLHEAYARATTEREQARAEAANLRQQLDRANTGRQKLQEQLDTQTAVAQGNKRHVAYLLGIVERVSATVDQLDREGLDDDHVEALRRALDSYVSSPASVPPRRAQEDHAQGYAEAVARLRDDARYVHWWSSTGVQPDGPLRQHLADYLETVGPEVEPAAQDEEASPRRLLDQAIESALPQAGGNVLALLKALRRELKRVDAKRAEARP